MLISTSPSTDARSGAARRVKEPSVWSTSRPFSATANVSRGRVCECVSNVNGLKDVSGASSPSCSTWTLTAPCCRLLLPVAAARGPALADPDADPGAMGGPGAGGAIRPRQVPHAGCLEVRLTVMPLHIPHFYFTLLSILVFCCAANRFWVEKRARRQYTKSPSRSMNPMDPSHCRYLTSLLSQPVTLN